MTVEELVDLLYSMPRDMEVKIAYPVGDYIGTMAADRIRDVDIENAMKTDYDTHWKLYNPENGKDDSETYQDFVIIQ